jgi:hypothetical protein
MDVNPEILCWNPRGLNDPAKCDYVRELTNSLSVNLVCFQETKMNVIDRFTIIQCLGPSFDGFDYLPAEETRGGILLAWKTSAMTITNISKDSFAITGEVHAPGREPWWITTVYGPQSTEDKIQFLIEQAERRSLWPGPWLVIGDFNMILRASEKITRTLTERTW